LVVVPEPLAIGMAVWFELAWDSAVPGVMGLVMDIGSSRLRSSGRSGVPTVAEGEEDEE